MSQAHALIIDDNIRNVNVLARLLSEQTVSSTSVTNSRLLETTLGTTDSPDVIFVDLEMPGLNGFDILKRLKADARFQGVPVIAYTVHISEMHEARQRGFDGFIGKPLDPDRFPGQLTQILQGIPVWETA